MLSGSLGLLLTAARISVASSPPGENTSERPERHCVGSRNNKIPKGGSSDGSFQQGTTVVTRFPHLQAVESESDAEILVINDIWAQLLMWSCGRMTKSLEEELQEPPTPTPHPPFGPNDTNTTVETRDHPGDVSTPSTRTPAVGLHHS